jgi:hypothetical protein
MLSREACLVNLARQPSSMRIGRNCRPADAGFNEDRFAPKAHVRRVAGVFPPAGELGIKLSRQELSGVFWTRGPEANFGAYRGAFRTGATVAV